MSDGPPLSPEQVMKLRPGQAAFPIVVSGPSGVGKTVVVKRLLELDATLVRSISATSRPRRGEEVDGVHYHFYDTARFEEVLTAGGFLEWARVHDHYYGTPKAPLEAHLAAGRGVVLNIDVQGGRQLKAARPDAVLVFLVPPSMEVLEARLRNRGTDSESEIATRLRNARAELAEAARYEYLVENVDIDRAGARIKAIVDAERGRMDRLLGRK